MTIATRNVHYAVNAVSIGQTRDDVDLLVKAAKFFVENGVHMNGFEDLIKVETLKAYNPDGTDRHIINWV